MGVDNDVVDVYVAADNTESNTSDGVTSTLLTVGAGILLLSFMTLPVQTPAGMMSMMQAMMGQTGSGSPTTIAGSSPQNVLVNVNQPSGTTVTGSNLACPTLTNIQNGNVIVQCQMCACTATYSCVQGYDINGISLRLCTSTSWIGTAPTCELAKCPLLNDPVNGGVITLCINQNRVCQAEYGCNNGFEIEGIVLRNCSSGIWDGADATCVAEQPPSL